MCLISLTINVDRVWWICQMRRYVFWRLRNDDKPINENTLNQLHKFVKEIDYSVYRTSTCTSIVLRSRIRYETMTIYETKSQGYAGELLSLGFNRCRLFKH